MALSRPVVIRAKNQTNIPLGNTMNEIRSWLDSEHVAIATFKTVAHHEGLSFEISFKSTQDASRFQRQFPWLVAID